MKIFYLHYQQPKAIEHLEKIGCPEMDVDFIFVDDGSKEPLKLDWKNATVYRIEEDVAWNQPAASNFGFSKMDKNDVFLKMDIDHYIIPDDLNAFKAICLRNKELIRFSRVVDYKKQLSPTNNIYLARVGDIVDVGGYDERFCGNYGHDDSDLIYRLRENHFNFRVHDNLKIHVKSDLGTRGLSRDTSLNKKLFELIKRERSAKINY